MSPYDDSNSISDDILRDAQEAIDDALKDKGLERRDRVVLEVQNYFLMFLRNDHRKVMEMYPYFVKAKEREENERRMRALVIGTSVAAVVMLFINGIIFWISTTPIVQAILKASQP